MTRGSFTTADGCRLHFVDAGHGTPVLWQHGLGATQAQVAEVFPDSSALRRITLECRGHAESDLGAPEELSIRQFADDALGLLDHLGVKRAAVGGISLGAAIAIFLAVHHPGRFDRLIVARPAWLDDSAPERLAIYRDVAELLPRFGPQEGLRRLQASGRYRRLLEESPDNAASMRSFFQRARPETTVALLATLPNQGSGVSREQLSRLSLPTRVIANEGDYVHPLGLATELAGLIPGATLKVIPSKGATGGGYVTAFRATLADFLTGRP
jgi:pimeloyl-ACP methyl ester carboxylesterase